MERELIDTFVTVSVMQNISKAARAMYVTQATVSHRLKELEQRLGTNLIVRSKGAKRTELTSAGMSFLPIARKWLQLDHELENFKYEKEHLEISIGSVNSVNNYFFNEFFRELKQDKITWHLQVKTLHTLEIYEQVRLNLIDIGFPLSRFIIPNLHVQKIHEENLMVVTQNPDYHKKMLRPSDLDIEQQIFFNWGEEYRRWHNKYFPYSYPPKFSVDSAKIALDWLDESSWFFAPCSVCMNFLEEWRCSISGLPIGSPVRELFMVTEKVTEQTRRREIILFKRRLLQFIRKKEQEFSRKLLDFYATDSENETRESLIK